MDKTKKSVGRQIESAVNLEVEGGMPNCPSCDSDQVDIVCEHGMQGVEYECPECKNNWMGQREYGASKDTLYARINAALEVAMSCGAIDGRITRCG